MLFPSWSGEPHPLNELIHGAPSLPSPCLLEPLEALEVEKVPRSLESRFQASRYPQDGEATRLIVEF